MTMWFQSGLSEELLGSGGHLLVAGVLSMVAMAYRAAVWANADSPTDSRKATDDRA
jgi:hypothetical protein